MKTHGVQVWSCGGGTQSGAMAALIGDAKLPRPDLCLMINTGRERSGTWPFVNGFIKPQLARIGLELEIVPASENGTVSLFSASGKILLPGFTSISGSKGKLSAYCSGTWKRDVTERYLRSIGVRTGTLWLGISADEAGRVRAPHRPWLQVHYPLVYVLRMLRKDCVALIRARGWAGKIPHSACWMCANASDAEWLEMKRDYPGDFVDACELEKEIQKTDPHFWLHPSCRPLADVQFEAGQTPQADRGCTEGCFT